MPPPAQLAQPDVPASVKRSDTSGRAKGHRVAQRTTKHEQLRRSILQMITDDPRQGRLLPSERDLATEHGISRMTARLVIEELADQGLVYRVHGLGTFVSGGAISKSLALTSFSEDMLTRGMRPSSRVLLARERPAGAAAGVHLQISPAEQVIEVRRVRLADDVPMCLESIELPAQLVPGLSSRPLAGSVYELLASEYRIHITRAEQRIRATVLDVEEAQLLEVPPVSPALLVERGSCDKAGRPVEWARSLYRADRYDFRVAVERRRSSK